MYMHYDLVVVSSYTCHVLLFMFMFMFMFMLSCTSLENIGGTSRCGGAAFGEDCNSFDAPRAGHVGACAVVSAGLRAARVRATSPNGRALPAAVSGIGSA